MASKLVREVFTSNSTWTCPAGVSQIELLMIGAGGGGGGGAGGGSGASGGPLFGGQGGRGVGTGSVGLYADCGQPGEILVLRNVPVIPGTAYGITVGAGGIGGAGGTGGAAQLTPNTAGNPGNPGVDGTAGGFTQFGQIRIGGGAGGSGCKNVPQGGAIGTGSAAQSGSAGLNGIAFQSLSADDRAGLGLGFPSGEWSTHAYRVLNFVGGQSGSAGSGSAPGTGTGAGGGGQGGVGSNLASLYFVNAYILDPNTQVVIPSGSRGGHGSQGANTSGSAFQGGNAVNPQSWNLGYGSGGPAGGNGGGSGGGSAPNNASAVGGQGSNGSNGQGGIVAISYVD